MDKEKSWQDFYKILLHLQLKLESIISRLDILENKVNDIWVSVIWKKED